MQTGIIGRRFFTGLKNQRRRATKSAALDILKLYVCRVVEIFYSGSNNQPTLQF